MQIKNILLAALFFATSQLSCADEQTDIKAKLQAELDAKCAELFSLDKKIIEQEIIYEAIKVKVLESFEKYKAWQKLDLTKEADQKKDDLMLKAEIFYNALLSCTKMQNFLFDEEYKKYNETDHEMLTFYFIKTILKDIELKNLVIKWKECTDEIICFERQICALQL